MCPSAPGRVSDRPCAISNFEYGIVCLRKQHDVRVGPLRIHAASASKGKAQLIQKRVGCVYTGRCGLHTRRRVCLYTVCGFCVFAPLARSAKPKAPKAVPVAHDQTPETSRARRRRNRTRRMRAISDKRYCFVPTHAAYASTPARATLIVIRRIMEG